MHGLTWFMFDLPGYPNKARISSKKHVPSLASPVLLLLILLVSGCSNKTDQNSSLNQDPASTTQAPVVGRATWYGPGLYGNKTASGEILQKNTLTAAHGQLPLGTKVRVTREDTNESVIVVINDRKPFKEGTIIDLAHGAADQLEIDEDGEAVVSLEILD